MTILVVKSFKKNLDFEDSAFDPRGKESVGPNSERCFESRRHSDRFPPLTNPDSAERVRKTPAFSVKIGPKE